MAVQIKTLVCPQCGSGRCTKVAGTPNLFACGACGTEFVLSDSNAPKEMRVIHSMDEGQFEKLKNAKYLALGLAAVVVLAMVAPLLWSLFRSAIPSAPDHGQLQASTVYESAAGQFSVVRVLEKSDGRDDHYQLLINSLESGKKLAEPVALSYQRTTLSQEPLLAHFSDGSVMLIMNGQKLFRLDMGTSQFISLDDELVNRHAQQLGTGVSRIELASGDKPDALIVTNNAGERFYVYWLTRQILPLARLYDDFRQRPFASYSQTQQGYAFAALDGIGDLSGAASSPSLLVRYTQKVRAGEYLKLPELSMQSSQEELVKLLPADYQSITPDWVATLRPLQESGVTQLSLVEPVQKRFRGVVLAQNAQRVLLVFNTTPVTDQGRVLQLLDAGSGKVVWSRTLEQLPQISGTGGSLSADGLPSGFYLRSDSRTPALLIDNQGQILHDFSPKRS